MIIPLRVERCGKGIRDKEGNGNVIHKSEQQAEVSIHDVERWSMVELQGEVVSSDPLSGQALGSMTFEKGKPTLVVQNHKLEGKVVPEGKPLLVLRKVVVEGGESVNGAGADVSDQPSRAAGEPRVEYSIVGKIHSKMIFKTRPKPLIRKLGTSAVGPRK